jgi:hypothetical protein
MAVNINFRIRGNCSDENRSSLPLGFCRIMIDKLKSIVKSQLQARNAA